MITAHEAAGVIAKNQGILVDVRTKEEINEGMAQPAEWLPLASIEAKDNSFQAFVKKTPKDKKIILYCKSGGRSGKAADLLKSEGFNTFNMGGFNNWTSANLPTKKP